jgi:hypothetical protein
LESSLHFFEKHKRPVSGPRIEKGRWVVEALRKHWNAKLFLKEALGKASAGDRAHIHKAMKKHCRVLDGKGLLGLARKNNGFKVFLTKYLKGKEEFLDY